MSLCPHQPHHPCRPQLLPFQYLQLPVLLQLEEGRVDTKLVGAAVENDVVNGDAGGVLAEVTEDEEGVAVLVIGVHGLFSNQILISSNFSLKYVSYWAMANVSIIPAMKSTIRRDCNIWSSQR